MPSESEFEAAFAALAASSSYQSGTTAQKDALIYSLLYSLFGATDVWGQFVEFIGDIISGIRGWIESHQPTIVGIGNWFESWWLNQFGVPFVWGQGSGGGGGS